MTDKMRTSDTDLVGGSILGVILLLILIRYLWTTLRSDSRNEDKVIKEQKKRAVEAALRQHIKQNHYYQLWVAMQQAEKLKQIAVEESIASDKGDESDDSNPTVGPIVYPNYVPTAYPYHIYNQTLVLHSESIQSGPGLREIPLDSDNEPMPLSSADEEELQQFTSSDMESDESIKPKGDINVQVVVEASSKSASPSQTIQSKQPVIIRKRLMRKPSWSTWIEGQSTDSDIDEAATIRVHRRKSSRLFRSATYSLSSRDQPKPGADAPKEDKVEVINEVVRDIIHDNNQGKKSTVPQTKGKTIKVDRKRRKESSDQKTAHKMSESHALTRGYTFVVTKPKTDSTTIINSTVPNISSDKTPELSTNHTPNQSSEKDNSEMEPTYNPSNPKYIPQISTTEISVGQYHAENVRNTPQRIGQTESLPDVQPHNQSTIDQNPAEVQNAIAQQIILRAYDLPGTPKTLDIVNLRQDTKYDNAVAKVDDNKPSTSYSVHPKGHQVNVTTSKTRDDSERVHTVVSSSNVITRTEDHHQLKNQPTSKLTEQLQVHQQHPVTVHNVSHNLSIPHNVNIESEIVSTGSPYSQSPLHNSEDDIESFYDTPRRPKNMPRRRTIIPTAVDEDSRLSVPESTDSEEQDKKEGNIEMRQLSGSSNDKHNDSQKQTKF